MKQVAIGVAIGMCLPLLCALYCGGETVAQAGIRLAAIEEGFRLASHHWQFEATPSHMQQVAYEEPKPAKKGKR